MKLFTRQPVTPRQVPAWPQSVSTIRVLLVDDDEDEMVILRKAFREISATHYELEWLASYGEGIARIADAEHDVYLIDYRLGGMNGLELVREARAAGCRAPLIMLTGERDPAVDLAAREGGAADFLEKGRTSPALLERSIRFAITQAQTLEALRRSHAQVAGMEEVGRNLSRVGPVPEALDGVVQLLTAPFDFSRAALYLLERDRYELAAQHGNAEHLGHLEPDQRLARVIDSGRPMLVPNLSLSGPPGAGMDLAAPLLADGGCHGVLIAAREVDAEVSEADFRALALIADRVAVALALNRAIRR